MTLTRYTSIWLLTFIFMELMTSRVHGATPDVCSPDHNTTCNCYNNAANQKTVSCSNQTLEVVPSPYPVNTSIIILSKNAITEVIVGPLIGVTNLIDLFLQDNYISYIQPGAFGRLMNVQQIILANNYIRYIDEDVFSHLPSLSVLDLSNNLIGTIDRYAFFYLPSLVLVNLEENEINCGCEEKLLKEFLDLRLGSLSLSNAMCRNFGDISITDVSTAQWAGVSNCDGETLFRPLGSNQCYTCADAKGLVDCQTKDRLQQCFGEKDVCYTRHEYSSNHLGVWGGCIDYRSCIGYEAQNFRQCNNLPPTTSCYFCNAKQFSNRLDVANTTRSFRLWALVTLAMDMTMGLSNNDSQEYLNFVNNIQIEFQNHVFGQKGSYLVEFVDLRLPRVTIALQIQASTMWFIKRSEVMETIQNKLLTVMYNGRTVEEVQVVPYHTGWCEPEVVQDATYGTLSWEQAVSETLSVLPCPFYTGDVGPYASRFCDAIGVWSPTNFTLCSTTPSQISNELQSLIAQDVSDENVDSVSSTVSEVSANWEVYQSEDVSLTVDLVEQILDTTSPSDDVIDNTVETINNVLFIHPDTLSEAQTDRNASTRLASVIDDFSSNLDVTANDFTAVKDNVALYVSHVEDTDDFEGRSMWLGKAQDGAFSDTQSSFRRSEEDAISDQSGIVLDSSLLDGLTAAEKMRVRQISIYALRDSKLYNSIADLNATVEVVLPNNKTVLAIRSINSNVISATVPGVTINNLEKPVTITFRHFEDGVNAECVFWDIDNRVWSGDGCTLNQTSSDVTVCHCSHLTNFALLMDVYGSGGKFSESDLLALSIISYVGCALSCVAVILTILTFTCFRRIKKDNPSKILVNLCVAIGLVNFVFIIGVQDYMSANDAACKIVGVLLHYFLLAVMCWMMVEAFYMYLALVKVFNTHVAHFQLKSSIFGWGIPLAVVIVTLSINKTDNYGLQPGGICWLERLPFYVAFLGPVCVTLIVNLVVFTLVLRQIFRRTSKKLSKSDSKRGTWVRVRGAIALVILLGLTWLFAILAVGDFGMVFHYLFALSNTLQGFFIFIFYCLLKPEAQAAWKLCLPCCGTPYEQDRTTTATSKGRRKERGVQERLVSSETTAMIQHKTEDTDSSNKATDSTDFSTETNEEPVKPEQNHHKASAPVHNNVYRGNYTMNIAVTRTSSYDA